LYENLKEIPLGKHLYKWKENIEMDFKQEDGRI
jgi:hypothetical protein